MSAVWRWIKARWNEPESRLAAAAILTTFAGELTGKIDAHDAALAVFGSVLAFVFPSTK